jgi:hypothetical protein
LSQQEQFDYEWQQQEQQQQQDELQGFAHIIIIMLPNQAIASTPSAPRPSAGVCTPSQ